MSSTSRQSPDQPYCTPASFPIPLTTAKATNGMATRMETTPFLFPMIILFALILPSLASGSSDMKMVQKTWCIAKPSSDEATLVANLNYACSQMDCSILQRGFSCFFQDTLMSHASIAMNLYYQARGRNIWNCHFKGSGLVVTTDPSFASCVYACP